MVFHLFDDEQTCSASGFPQAALYWLKDGQPLRTGDHIRVVSRERISVMSVAREDRGMYQCFVRNEHEMAQGIAELRLGGKRLYWYIVFNLSVSDEALAVPLTRWSYC